MRRVLPFVGIIIIVSAAQAQISTSSYRALGQRDLRQNGVNVVEGVELHLPAAATVDTRDGVTHIYIADTGNCRVLGWPDVASYQIGDPPAIILGQPGPNYAGPMGIGTRGFNLPYGLAVDPATGNLYAIDFGNNRILRFPAPFSNPAAFTPDAVIGQPNFSSFGSGIGNSALNKPQAIAFDSAGDLWVADTGNHRVLRFPADVLDGRSAPQADLVVGQRSFTSGGANSGGAVSASGFNGPDGIGFDGQNNLYVADYNNARILKFTAPVGANAAASSVIGQTSFTARVIGAASSSSFAGPAGITVSSSGALYVSVPTENRVLVFLGGASTASTVYGQSTFTTAQANAASQPLASPNGLSSPVDVKVDSTGRVFIVDGGNSRVLYYPANSRSAARVWGQSDFIGHGKNQIKPGSIDAPYKMTVDYSRAPFPLYVSDTNNHRVLIWKDSAHFRSGDPADLVIGQPDLRSAFPNADTGSYTPTATSLFSPRGIAVDAAGNLYVADSGNNRVLRYPKPVDQAGRIAPDAVLGQPGFTSSAAGTATASSLQSPSGVAVAANGELFVADSGNHRVLKYLPNAGSGAAAVQVYGQPNFSSNSVFSSISPQTVNSPTGLFVDASYNLYVADTGNNRVLIFSNVQSIQGNGPPASLVYGQPRFDSGAPGFGAAMRGPADVSLDRSGNVYVSDTGNHRVLVFPSFLFAQPSGTLPTGVLGQRDFSTTTPNWNSPDSLATAESLFGPLGVFVDRKNTLYVGDAGNNRVLHFLRASAVVNSAHYLASVPVAQGSAAALFSANIADQPETAAAPLPTSLASRQIVVNDTVVAPLYGVAVSQINFQVPSAAPMGANRIAVRTADTGELIAGGGFSVGASAPGLFSIAATGAGQGAITNQDTSLNGANRPAARGTVITLYGTGQGQVSPPVLDGMPAAVSPLSRSVTIPASDAQSCLGSEQSVCVVLGSNTFGTIQFSGLAPSFVGLWQINVLIPSNAPTGNAVPVKVVINSVPSNTVTVAIQ